MSEFLQQAWTRGLLRPVDYHLARHLQRLVSGASPLAALLAAATSRAVGQGDVCLDLALLADEGLQAAEGGAAVLPLPPLAALQAALQQWPAVGAAGEFAPLILDGQRLYLGRYWHYEHQVAQALLARARAVSAAALDQVLLEQSLQRLFPQEGEGTDWQRVAAETALRQDLCVISGGPGTGKTHTVASILALLLEQAAGRPCRMALVAPTGKAAARLTEALRKARTSLACSEAIKQAMPDSSATIHRLLGLHPGAVRPRFHRDNPLDLDALIVDEASMVDLPLMARLLQALPPGCRLLLLGDKDQLASVEAGSVFADLVNTGVGDSVVQLHRSYRFRDDAGIGALARAVNQGNAAQALALLRAAEDGLQWQRVDAAGRLPALLQQVDAHLEALFSCASAAAALAWLESFRILCAVRKGPFGVEQVNRDVEQLLRQRGLVGGSGELYRGRPVMITHNAPASGLFNGDVGILWPAEDGSLKAWFQTPQLGLKALSPARLPAHETAWAMTVHKSQGSEFGRVLLILPGEANPLLTRELLYTGITRARTAVELWAQPEIVAHCVGSRVQRRSGLAERLASVQAPHISV